MQFTTSAAVALAALLPTALAAGSAVVQNNCQQQVFLTITRADQTTTTQAIDPGQAYSEGINGSGNSFGLTTNSDYFSPNTPKLIWGFSDAAPTLYYSINTVDGYPFSDNGGFNLATTDSSCGTVNTIDGRTRTCGDGATFTLTTCQS